MWFIWYCRQRLKSSLRDGGTLPNLTYDKETNTAEYSMFFGSNADNTSNQEILLPVPSIAQVDVFLNIVFSKLALAAVESPEHMEILALHEIAEAAIIDRMKTPDPYKRWFTDGFANAIAYEVARDHYSQSAADAFIAQYATDSY